MALPVFFPTITNTIDNTNLNVSIVKSISTKNSSFGGISFVHHILPDGSGGSVIVSNYTSGDNNKTYDTSSFVIPHMALIDNSNGGVVTPIYGDAITSLNKPFNFVGISLTSASSFVYVWNEKNVTSAPSPRYGAQLVFDSGTSRSTLFGGISGTQLADTWEWDGSTWIQRSPLTNPPARGIYGMSYDSDRNRMVMYGGIGSSSILADTWEWDTIGWNNRSDSTPGQLSGHTMCYDSHRQKTVLFGGSGIGSPNNRTWEWDGSAWTQIITAHAPSARVFHSMVFDSNRGRTVLFGGSNGGIVFNAETWEYDGIDWKQVIIPGAHPSARFDCSMVFNSLKRVVMLFGGIDSNINALNDTWQYDGITWIKLDILSMSPRALQMMDYNPEIDKVVIFGGVDQTLTVMKGDTWELGSTIMPVLAQTSGDTLVYYDATGILPIMTGKMIRSGSNTVLVSTTLPYTLNVGDTIDLSPGEANFVAGTKTISSVLDGYNFTYVEAGTNTSNTLPQLMTTQTARPIPQINDFLGPSAISGTLTTVVDGYSPIFGYAITAPIIDPLTNNFYQTIIPNNSYVGLTKMRIEPFIGFIPPASPTINNFTPTFGSVGDIIIMNGAGFLGVSQVIFDGYSPISATFSTISNDQIYITVPAGAQRGTISLINSFGNATSAQTFHVIPKIINVTASTHAVGSSVSITGYTFLHVFSITFNGTNQPIFTIIDDSHITTTIPSGATTGNIVITDADGSAIFSNFEVIPVPIISSGGITPLLGTAGSVVSVAGSGFTAHGSALDGYGILTFVRVGGGQTLSTTRTVFDDTQISAIVPSMPGGQASTTYNIVFTNDGGSATSIQMFSIQPPPTFLDAPGPTFSPTSGAAGTNVDLFGKYGFSSTSSVFFGNYPAPSVTLIQAQSSIGNVNRISSVVSVTTTLNHNFITNDVVFVQASLDANFPSAFVVVNVTGTNTFTYSQSGANVINTAIIVFVDDSHIKAQVPITSNLLSPDVAISITAAGGVTSTTDSNAAGSGPTAPQHFTILLQPIITSFTPNFGATGSIVQIFGNNMLSVDRVFFTSHNATANSGQVSRSGSTVSVTTASAHVFTNGDTILVDSIDANFISLFTIVAVTGGNTFTYTQAGSATSSTTSISFFDAAANALFTIINNGQVNATVPVGTSGIDNGPIIVSSGSLFAVSGSSFTYVPIPTISGINKSSGGYGFSPTQVIISGAHLLNSDSTAPTVLFGGVAATVISASSGSITVNVPFGAGDNITLTTNGGTAPVQTFHVVKQPIIYNSTPTYDCEGNSDPITIAGNNFIQADSTYNVYFYYQTFNAVTPTSVTNTQVVVNNSSLTTYWNTYANSGNNFSVTFTIYFYLYYDGGAGFYQIASPQTFTDNSCVAGRPLRI